jgi:uncharacterized NAD(P)/FAD-binding protein YdhS
MAVSTPEQRTRLRPRWSRETVAIVGGGAAGTLAAIHLVKRRAAPEIVLIESSHAIGEGVAYSTCDECHLLNIPAGRMSAYGDDPGHFARWLEQSGLPNASPEMFAPRLCFGQYLRETLEDCVAHRIGSVHVELVSGLAVTAQPAAAGLEIALADGSTLDARRVVLAVGQSPSRPPWPNAPRLTESERCVSDPWAPGSLDRIQEGDRVALVGAGLTMADVALTLAARGAHLTAVSRHGLQPLSHDPGSPSGHSHDWLPRGRLVDLFRDVRNEAEAADTWHTIVDSVRPHAQDLWRLSSFEAQSQFLRHVSRYWEVHRHRMAPTTATALSKLIVEGQLSIRSGAILDVVETDDGVELALRPRFADQSETLRANYLVNCTGPGEMIDSEPQRLLASLFQQGLVQPDAHRLGLAVTESGELIGTRGMPGSLVALGALRRGTLWETTAIAEIRAQAEALASLIARRSQAIDPV